VVERYDIVFMGSLGSYTVVPFDGAPFTEGGGPALFGAIAASCLPRKVAIVTRTSDNERGLLEPLRDRGIGVFEQSGETPRYRISFPTANVDEREAVMLQAGTHFVIDDVPAVEPCLIHLSGLGLREFSLDFVQALKARGFRVSLDMQCFMFAANPDTRAMCLEDIPEKKALLRLVDFAKVDVVEASILTGTDIVEDQAAILEAWGCTETLVTSSQGALAHRAGRSTFVRFTNRSARGRMGRGDTFCSAYIAARLDHSVEESLRFAAAMTSIKLETPGPFAGTLKDVITRMEDPQHSGSL
jgi:sugar/nucleoside kinase (ribokinase family)